MGEEDIEMQLGLYPQYSLTWAMNFGFRCCYCPHNTPTQTALVLSNYLPQVQNSFKAAYESAAGVKSE